MVRLLNVNANGRDIRLGGTFDDKGKAGGWGAAAVSALVFLPAGFWRVARELRHKIGDKATALSFIRQAPKRHGSPEAITTDGRRSYKVAMDELSNAEKQEIGRWANTGSKTHIFCFEDESEQC